jgi:hypothetical protein
MPAKSKEQKRLMQMALAHDKGELDTSDMDDDFIEKLEDIANGMSREELRKFATEPVQESRIRQIIREEIRRLSEGTDNTRIVQALYELMERGGLNPRIKQQNVVEFGDGYDYVRVDQHDQHFFDVKISVPGMTKTHRISVRDSETAEDAATEIYDKLARYGI